MNKDRFHDSAGVPWEGREFSQNAWSTDDGSAPPALERALSAEIELSAIFSALRGQRLLVPLIAQLGEAEIGPHGNLVDKSAELSIVAVSTPDGGSAIPAFSSVAQLTSWRADARPVPVDVEKLALAAIAEGHNRVVLDPAAAAVGLRRPFLAALAQGLDWVPPSSNLEVRELVVSAAANFSQLLEVKLVSGDPRGSLQKPELILVLRLEPGLSSEMVQALVTEFSAKLQSSRFLELVESVGIKLIS